ncbi:50S ribosomal protein L25/general stress protein Ctc [Candidatus Nitrosacidococcus tergens]|uniref:Large ribosomal subunit protein bL25 n=1 Tax=Candidatus Nitrosacidococcus tergens TaxID=553981 RepID=A0A7G1QC08_9GAMM|nr:50S ribosomal protein L25/general stress protein Ctc [Candidatus Nitrosacidococcus tergens]CAB1277586.1 50S ribosomal protein L25 [Candidatus Nitrosacidococcus tergens]
MENIFQLSANIRNTQGKGESRRLRRAGKVPAVLYGAEKPSISLVFDHNVLTQHLEHEAFYSHILTIDINGKKENVVLKALQRVPQNPNKLVHIDLLRVSATHKLSMHVPLHFIGHDTAPAVKRDGGIVSHQLNEVEISCYAKDLPEYIQVDITDLEVGKSLHLADLKLPTGVDIPSLKLGEDHNQPVVTIHKQKTVASDSNGEESAE